MSRLSFRNAASFRWGASRSSRDLFEPEYYVYEAAVVSRAEHESRKISIMSGSHAHHDFQIDDDGDKCINGVDSNDEPFFDDEVLVGVRRRALKHPEIDAENAFYFGPKRHRIDRGFDDDYGQRWDVDHLEMYAGRRNNPYAANFEHGEVVS
mmetsp:Transcript_1841/g.2944  ORF Transcript_1841/g.2944 Transcript_1841/m.2944 type:complete len:152 (+) Transcript_1841:182-637(+)